MAGCTTCWQAAELHADKHVKIICYITTAEQKEMQLLSPNLTADSTSKGAANTCNNTDVTVQILDM
jgi:hypothetical protein